MGTSDNTNTKRSTVQLYLIELVLRLMDKIFYLPRFGIPSIKFKDLIIMFPPCMFKGEGQAPIPRAQMMEIIYWGGITVCLLSGLLYDSAQI